MHDVVYLPGDGIGPEVSDAARQECLEAGMDGYIAKPLRIEDLAIALRKT